MPSQTEYWNELAGPRWVDLQESLDRLLEPLGRQTMALAEPQPGERVLDVGCGCGHTTLDLARQVGPSGQALGLDISRVMLARARERAAAVGSAARFRLADVEVDHFEEGPFDLAFSRFGTMFFPAPVQAFGNLRRALRPDGRLVFVCWRPVAENPLFRLPLQAAEGFVKLPEPTPPEQPGPFSLAAAGRAAHLLQEAGWRQIDVQPWDGSMAIGDRRATADLLLRVGPSAAPLAEADPGTRERVAERLRELLNDLEEEGRVVLPARSWLVRARP